MMSGSIGSGSVPVIPVGVGDEVAVEDDVEDGLVVSDANALAIGPVNNTGIRTYATRRETDLNIGMSPLRRKCALGRRLDIKQGKADL
jgi:hypothetical protein